MAFVGSTGTVSVGDITKKSHWDENKANTNWLHDDILGISGDAGLILGVSGGPGTGGAISVAGMEMYGSTAIGAEDNSQWIGMSSSPAGTLDGPGIFLFGGTHATDPGKNSLLCGATNLASGAAYSYVSMVERNNVAPVTIGVFDVDAWTNYSGVYKSYGSQLDLIPGTGAITAEGGLRLNDAAAHVFYCQSANGVEIGSAYGNMRHAFRNTGSAIHYSSTHSTNGIVFDESLLQTRFYNKDGETAAVIDCNYTTEGKLKLYYNGTDYAVFGVGSGGNPYIAASTGGAGKLGLALLGSMSLPQDGAGGTSGDMRFNTSTLKAQVYVSGAWVDLH